MVCTHLFVLGGKYRSSLSIFDVASFFQEGELPSDKTVVVGVQLCGDKRSAVIDVDAEALYVFPPNWREVFYPAIWINKLTNGLGFYSQLQHDFVLIFCFAGGQSWRVSVICEFEGKFFCCCRYGHS